MFLFDPPPLKNTPKRLVEMSWNCKMNTQRVLESNRKEGLEKRFQWSNSQTWKFKFYFCRECLDRVSIRPGNSRSLGNVQKFFPGLKYVLEYEIRGVLSWKSPEIFCRYCVSVQTLPISWCNNNCMCLFPTFLPLI